MNQGEEDESSNLIMFGDYVGDPSAFDFGTGDFTVAFWGNKRTASSDWSNLWGMWKWISGPGGSINEWTLSLTSTGSNDIPSFGEASGSDVYSSPATTEMTLDTWYHLAGVREGTDLTIYVYGVAEGTTSMPVSTSINNVGRETVIGGRHTGGLEPNAIVRRGASLQQRPER